MSSILAEASTLGYAADAESVRGAEVVREAPALVKMRLPSDFFWSSKPVAITVTRVSSSKS